MIVLTRVDNRLIHGQVIEAWLPHLKVKRVVVADDEAAKNPVTRTALSLAMPDDVALELVPLLSADFSKWANDAVPTLLLLREVEGAVTAYARGLPHGPLNLGNVHSGPQRESLTRAVFLSAAEREQLRQLTAQGISVSAQAVPNEKAVVL